MWVFSGCFLWFSGPGLYRTCKSKSQCWPHRQRLFTKRGKERPAVAVACAATAAAAAAAAAAAGQVAVLLLVLLLL